MKLNKLDIKRTGLSTLITGWAASNGGSFVNVYWVSSRKDRFIDILESQIQHEEEVDHGEARSHSLAFQFSGVRPRFPENYRANREVRYSHRGCSEKYAERLPWREHTNDAAKSDYTLEAMKKSSFANGTEKIKFDMTLFDKDGTAVFSTSTWFVSNAVKDVCKAIKSGRK